MALKSSVAGRHFVPTAADSDGGVGGWGVGSKGDIGLYARSLRCHVTCQCRGDVISIPHCHPNLLLCHRRRHCNVTLTLVTLIDPFVT